VYESVAEDVAVREPIVPVPEVIDEKTEVIPLNRFVKKLVVVADVIVAFVLIMFVRLAVPVVVILSSPTSIEPNPEVIEPEFKAPVDVREEYNIPEPRVVAERTSAPLILYVAPVGIFIAF